jgi:hypothetical protein
MPTIALMMRGMNRRLLVCASLLLAACMGVDTSKIVDGQAGEASAPATDAAIGAGAAPDAAVVALPDAAAPSPGDARVVDAAPTVASDAVVPIVPIGRPPAVTDAAPRPGAVDASIAEPDAALAEPDAAPAEPDAAEPPPVAPPCGHIRCDCTFAGHKLFGKVKYVTFPETPDFKVKLAGSDGDFPDLHVQKVDFIPQRCGEWREDALTPDFKVQVVTDFEDFAILYVPGTPGLP